MKFNDQRANIRVSLSHSLWTGWLLAAAAAAAGLLLYGAWCAFTCGKYTLLDYGMYTSMIWNCAHGDWFHVMLRGNYLYTHLSFTLALLGPLFRIWDHPFLLALIQWLMLIAGGILLFRAGRRRIPLIAAVALIFFYFGYRFTQATLLSEFHTVGAYFLLVPWLYVLLLRRSIWAWIPCLLTLGLREDAFLFLIPLVLYFAVRYRWPMAYVMVAAVIAYGVLAIFVLYPAINDVSIFVRRANYIKDPAHVWSDPDGWLRRLHAGVLTLLPVIAASRRRCWIPLFFSSAALATAFMSAYPTQQGLGSMYSAPVMTMIAVGMLEAMIRDGESGVFNTPSSVWITALALPIITLAVHLYSGFLPGGGKHSAVYGRSCAVGKLALCAAKHLPKKGVLLTDERLAGFCANRRDIIIWNKYSPEKHGYDVVFTTLDSLHTRLDGELFEAVKRNEFGLRYHDDYFFIAERGYDPSANAALLDGFWMRPVKISSTCWHAGEEYFSRTTGLVRHWHPRMAASPVNVCYGQFRHVDPGTYTAVLRYRARRPRNGDAWGRFSLHTFNAPEERAGIDLEARNADDGASWIEKTLTFHVDQPARIEPRITAGDAELWLDKVVFFHCR